jgi:uncharacterized protein YbjQ (UPF0145 family)
MARGLTDSELRATLAGDRGELEGDAIRALEEEVTRRGLRVHPWPDQSYLPVTTGPGIDGHEVTRVLGVIGAEHVLGINVIREFIAGVTDFVGGRSGVLQAELRTARESCLRELATTARDLNADAVIATSFQLSEFTGQGKSMILVQASGTAVQLRSHEAGAL